MPRCMLDALELLLLIVSYYHVTVSPKEKFLKLMVLLSFARHAVLCVDCFLFARCSGTRPDTTGSNTIC